MNWQYEAVLSHWESNQQETAELLSVLFSNCLDIVHQGKLASMKLLARRRDIIRKNCHYCTQRAYRN